MPGPLDGIRVVELGVWVAGPGAGGILADWGADVVKIEPPGGDPARQFLRMLSADLPFNPPFELDNRGKRGMVIDLGGADGRVILEELLAGADVLVTNLRMAALSRLGLQPERVTHDHPGLVYGVITGYGTEGPERDRAAYDIGAFWARSGLVSLLTQPGQDPPFQRGGMGDHGSAMALVAGITSALVSRSRTGRGQLVTTSLLRQGAYTIGFDLNTAIRLGRTIAVGTRQTMANPLINSYRAGDGQWLWLLGLEGERHWPDLADAVRQPDLLVDPRFATAGARAVHCRELVELLDERFATADRAEWGRRLDQAGMWWAPIQTLDEVLADPQLVAGGGLVEVPDGGSTTTMVATPLDFAGTPWAPRSMPPHLGEHTDEVLRELGRSEDEIARLRATGAVA